MKSQAFITSDLNNTLSAAGVASILNLNVYPWGNAYYNIQACGAALFYDKTTMFCWIKNCGAANAPADCFSAPILCQHGADECAGNDLEMCATSLATLPAQQVQLMQFFQCFEVGHRAIFFFLS